MRSFLHAIAFGDASYTVIEGTKVVNVKVVRRGYMGSIVSVDVVSSQITATEGLTYDYPPVSHTVVFGANNDPQEAMVSFEIEIGDDDNVENTEYFQLELVNCDGCLIGEPSVAEVTIADNDVSYCFEKDVYNVMESNNEVIINVRRKGFLGQQSQIGIFTRDISASSTPPNHDYVPLREVLSHDVIFEPDEDFKQVTIGINDDTFFEVTEEFEVILISDIAQQLSFPREAVVAIRNDDIDCAIDCHNGFCVSPEECQCLDGYTGNLCEEDINECELQPPICRGGNVHCLNKVGSYECICTDPELNVVGNMCVRKTRIINGRLYATAYNGQPIQFTDEIYDVTSDEFEFWADILEPEFNNALSGISGYQNTSISRLFPAEDGLLLGVEYDVNVASSSPADETDINALLAANINSDGYFGGSVVSVKPPAGQFSEPVDGVFYAADVNDQPFDSALFDTDSARFQAFVNEVEPNKCQPRGAGA
ncbi:uncharacterized protein [Amphiura filiformis]|uniref:uncharacterized protein n=1 Tax=Amphiura filiformis TaxID=82378 RepID=UPI003B220D32